jgi:hypothetical protein
MSKERFAVEHYQTLIQSAFGGFSCKVYDRVTGNVGYGEADTWQEAERRAWRDLRRKQGPLPSELEEHGSSGGK